MRVGDGAPTPLSDLRVVEVSDRIAGSYCGKLLVDAGADVVKVEPEGGDPLRRFSASGAAPSSGADSPLFSYLNAGKRSVTTGSETLLARADIIVVTASRAAAITRGIDPQRLLGVAPHCIVVTISDFGWTGPWAQRPATEFTLQAWSGLTGFRGDPAGPPISIGGELGEYMGGAFAAFGAIALRRRVRAGGPGGHLDLSMLEAITLMQSGEWLHSQLLAVPPIKRSVEVPSIEPAKDGYVGISMVTGQQWLDFAAMVDCPEFTEIPELRFQLGRWAHRDWIRERIGPWMRERTVDEIVELGQLFRLPVAPLGNGSTIPHMNHMRERGVYIDNPAGFRQPRAPWLMSVAAPAAVRKAPELGDADGETLWEQRQLPNPTPSHQLPLAGCPGRRPHRVLGRACGDALAGGVRGGRDQGRVDPAPGRHPLLRRNAHGRRRLVGVRLGLPRDEHQQAVGDTRPGVRRRHPALQDSGEPGRRGDRELLAAGDRPVRARRRRAARTQARAGGGADACVRVDGTVARPRRLRPHDGADRGPGLDDRDARRASDRAPRRLRPARGCPCGVRTSGWRWNSPSRPGAVSLSRCR